MSVPPVDAADSTVPARRDRRAQAVGVGGLASIAVGAALLDGPLPLVVALVTAVVWWRLSTPLAITTLTVGLVAVVPPVAPLVQFGATVGALGAVGVPVVAFGAGTALLTVGSWLAAGTEPPLVGGWTLLPLAVGWLCIAGAVLADTPLWIVLAVCGGLTLLGANAITQLTNHRLSTATATTGDDETAPQADTTAQADADARTDTDTQ